jgi:polar amino acid transport system permease protein
VVQVPYQEIFLFLLDGVVVTLKLTLVSFFFILIAGMIGGLGRVSNSKVLAWLASLYVEIVRGIPVLVWLLWIWFALPQLLQMLGRSLMSWAPRVSQFCNFKLQPFMAAVMGLPSPHGAYMTEIFRAGIQSVPRPDGGGALARHELSAGMRYIVLLPGRASHPAARQQRVRDAAQDSSLVSILAVSDLTEEAASTSPQASTASTRLQWWRCYI